jgi:hypothetical protein
MEWRKGFDFVSAFPGYVRQVGEKTGQRRGGSGVSSAIALDLPKRLYGGFFVNHLASKAEYA